MLFKISAAALTCAAALLLPALSGCTAKPATGVVPEPAAVDTSPYLVGAVMCPLWQDGSRWADIERFPERKPLLGWYDEGHPEVTDWEIKWALEHGISFFLLCWYRDPATNLKPEVEPVLGHWIHEGLPRSRYGGRFRFAIMWENANPALPCDTSYEDFTGHLVPYWINEYFKRENYLVIDGKPVFSIYNADRFVEELGGEAAASEALLAMRRACVEAGFAGVHILGQYCWGNPAELARQAALIQRLGMDASWSYHLPTFTGAFGAEKRPAGTVAVAAQTAFWERQADRHIPTLSMGWDEAPWNFRYSRAQWRLHPGEFKELAVAARDLLSRRQPDHIAGRMVLLDNWNEYGEGHYILPAAEHGFGYLDAIREVFAPDAGPHTDLVPEDVGLGPYDARYREWRRAKTETGNP